MIFSIFLEISSHQSFLDMNLSIALFFISFCGSYEMKYKTCTTQKRRLNLSCYCFYLCWIHVYLNVLFPHKWINWVLLNNHFNNNRQTTWDHIIICDLFNGVQSCIFCQGKRQCVTIHNLSWPVTPIICLFQLSLVKHYFNSFLRY